MTDTQRVHLTRVPAVSVTDDLVDQALRRVRIGLAGPGFSGLHAIVRDTKYGDSPPVLDFLLDTATGEPLGFVGWERYANAHLLADLPGSPWASWTGLAPALRGTGLLPTLRCWQAHQADTIREHTHPQEPVFLSSIATWNEQSQRASASYARRQGWTQHWRTVTESHRDARLLIWPTGIPHTCTTDPRLATQPLTLSA